MSNDFWFKGLHVRLFLVQNGWPNSKALSGTDQNKNTVRGTSLQDPKWKKEDWGYQYGWTFAPIVLVHFHLGCYILNPFSHCYREGAGSKLCAKSCKVWTEIFGQKNLPTKQDPGISCKVPGTRGCAQNLHHPANSTKVWQEDQAKNICRYDQICISLQVLCNRTSVFFSSDQMSQSNKASVQIAQMEKKPLADSHLCHILAPFQPMDAFFPRLHGLFMSGGIPKLYHFHRMELSKTVAACTVPFFWAWILDHNFMPSRIKFR